MGLRALSRAELRGGLVARRRGDHKGVYGHALLIVGSRGMAGAAILAARGALRSGAGLVTAAVPAGIASMVAGAVPSALTLGLPEDSAGALRSNGVEVLRRYARERRVTAFALGPGLSIRPGASRLALGVLEGLCAPGVVDADALNALAALGPAGAARLLRARAHPCIFTPHPAEMSRALKTGKIVGEARRIAAVESLARRWGGVALLKGHRTLISSGARTVVNLTGGPGLAKAGSGDVLTGLVLGLWTQALASGRLEGDLAFKSASLGAWLHGVAGDMVERELTPWAATSSDLVDYLPRAFKAL